MKFSTLGIMLGHRCNARCRSCLWGDSLDLRTDATVQDACSWIDQASQLGTIRVVGFSGGEPFLRFNDMRAVMYHAAKHHGLPSGVTTNAYWATSDSLCRERLGQLRDVGLRTIAVSVDDFHQEWVPLANARRCICAAKELGMSPVIQCVITRRSSRLSDYMDRLELTSDVIPEAVEINLAPIGYAASRVKSADLITSPGIPSNYCTSLQTVNILPNGSVHLCCGAAFAQKGLAAGNIFQEHLTSIVERAEWDPLFNSLAIAKGPRHLGELLRSSGHPWSICGEYSSSCHACHHLIQQPGAAEFLRQQLEPQREELFLKRHLLMQLASEETNKTADSQEPAVAQ